MENKKEKVIYIRLIYVIIVIIMIVGVIIGTKKILNKRQIEKIAETSYEIGNDEEIQISEVKRNEIVEATSRSENLSRGQESEEEQTNTENLQTEDEITKQQEENIIEEIKEKEYIQISEVKISKNMDLTVRTGLSREEFIKLIAGVKADTSGFFEENAGLIYDLCEQYSLNEIFFCGVISAESGWDIAQNHRATHNYISLMKNGKLLKFSSVESGLQEAAKRLHNNYLTPGGKFYRGKTLAAVKTKFCPASSTWVDLVYGRMSQIIK